MATGIKDKVAILGMGCSTFGERWDAGSPELMKDGLPPPFQDTFNDMWMPMGSGPAGFARISNPTTGLTHDLGGVPCQGIAATSILGLR